MLKHEHKIIIDLITEFLEQPNANHLRFGQALFNLGIIEFANQDNPEEQKHLLKDIHNDSDGNIISRIKNNYKIIK